MKYYLVYALDAQGSLTKIKGFSRDKGKAKTMCFETNCAISEIIDLDEETTETSESK